MAALEQICRMLQTSVREAIERVCKERDGEITFISYQPQQLVKSFRFEPATI